MGSDKVDITLKTGWSGGYVSAIETNCKFFCAEWKEKDSCKIIPEKDLLFTTESI